MNDTAHKEWAKRPDEERFWTVEDLLYEARFDQQNATELKDSWGNTQLVGTLGGVYVGVEGVATRLNSHAFDQVCADAGAPANYLRKLPGTFAAECLKKTLPMARKRVFLTNGGTCRGVTSESYERLWDAEVIESILVAATEVGYRVPPGMKPWNEKNEVRTRKATADDEIDYGGGLMSIREGDEIAPSGLYRSESDMFALLVNPQVINGPNDRPMSRAIMISHCEVGGSSICYDEFILDFICGNHYLWGANKVQSFRTAHRGTARQTMETVVEHLKATFEADANLDGFHELTKVSLGTDPVELVQDLSKHKLGKKKAEKILEGIIEPTAWDFLQSYTEMNRDLQMAERRVEDRMAVTVAMRM